MLYSPQNGAALSHIARHNMSENSSNYAVALWRPPSLSSSFGLSQHSVQMAGQRVPHFHPVCKNTGAYLNGNSFFFSNEFLWQSADNNSQRRMKTVSILALLCAGGKCPSMGEMEKKIHLLKEVQFVLLGC